MAAPEASCSSRNQAVRYPLMCDSVDRTEGSHNHDLMSDGSNIHPFPIPDSDAINLGIAKDSLKEGFSPPPRGALSMSAIHSTWIRRLKPSLQVHTQTEQLSKKDDFICTHFTKDYSSSSRRLNKSTNHTRSSSWPPHEMQSDFVRQPVKETACVGKKSSIAAMNPSEIVKSNFRVPTSKNTAQISEAGSRTGSLFLQQQDCQDQGSTGEGFVPCFQHSPPNQDGSGLQKLNFMQHGDHGKAQKQEYYLGKLTKDDSTDDCLRLSEWAKRQVYSQRLQNKGSFVDSHYERDFVNASCLPIATHGTSSYFGASADADESSYFIKPSKFGFSDKQNSSLRCLKNFDFNLKTLAEDSTRNVEDKGIPSSYVFSKKEAGLGSQGVGFYNTRMRAIPKAKQNFHLFKEAVMKPYLQSGFSMVGSPEDINLNRSKVSEFSTQITQNTSSKGRGTLQLKGYDDPMTQDLSSGDKGLLSRFPGYTRSALEVAKRFDVQDKLSGDYYWDKSISLIEEHDFTRPINTGHSTRESCAEFDHELFQQKALQRAPNKHQELSNFSSNHLQKFWDTDKKESSSCNPGPNYASPEASNKLLHRELNFKQPHESSDQYRALPGVADRRNLQFCGIKSGFDRRHETEKTSHSRMHSIILYPDVINSDRGRKEQDMNKRWLQRWHPAEKFSSLESHVLQFGKDKSSSSNNPVQFPESYATSAMYIVGSNRSDVSLHNVNLAESYKLNKRDFGSSMGLDTGTAHSPEILCSGRNLTIYKDIRL
ncbi:hypothetical protein KP509_04G043200 [Ceratopteris richardii]|uniref:Uncharacterized protein n=1 Tax=Ceratopteris richardii TaxID=49495 RepID=A0A8T2V4A9_CERRI|nr:hypothetical protein KP509_04G043200 [Ceratopteris richardii]